MLRSARTPDLQNYLDQASVAAPDLRGAARIIAAIAASAAELADLIALGGLAGKLGAQKGSANQDGDIQKELDVVANDVFVSALQQAGAGVVVSEELRDPLVLNSDGVLAIAIDPLDGSSNIDANVSIGTIFSIMPMLPAAADLRMHFLQPGHQQLASGFVIYGPQTSIVFTLGSGTTVFTLDRKEGQFRQAVEHVSIPRDSVEYAINASNTRHWSDAIQAFINACVKGTEGPLKRNHNMRWIASLVADCYRILMRGGLFLYPADQRTGYGEGRLRLLYEANPIAFLVEQAGGKATNCRQRILDVIPTDIHGRVPLVLGSADQVDLVQRYHADPQFYAEQAPLFGKRGLIRN
ncbi:class 1 fructose-bisphosphatase [Beijerinckia mobilis]|uniref:class 1 fructose-bisphosphatase n=1 Tax=Beijerinckia mobilis TaxID=231434 RepID=UPI0009FBBA31|nr:class 1 fructose-bisphosphatase [Beijerinckia mobilis]